MNIRISQLLGIVCRTILPVLGFLAADAASGNVPRENLLDCERLPRLPVAAEVEGMFGGSIGDCLVAAGGNQIAQRQIFDQIWILALGAKGFLFVETEIVAGRRLPVISLHLHHSSRKQRLLQAGILMKFMIERRNQRVARKWVAPPILCGDFNNPPHQPDATAMLLGYCEETNNYALLPKTDRTFPAALPALVLDLVLLPQECRPLHAEVVRCYLSDHRPVLVEFELD
ncbi:MAG: hypothetical protein EXS42_02010 [Lacunisphaera sp.]|nr:hypothetical protein [Lacunisphaera sp.]